MKLGSKYKIQKRIALRGTIVVLVILCALISVSVVKRYQIEREMAARVIEIQHEYDDLQKRKAMMEEKVEYLKDDRSVEAQVRRSFDVAREGEQVVIILDDEDRQATSSPLPTPPPPVPWYQFWR